MSTYSDKLNAICDDAERLTGTGGGRALRKIVMDLGGDGPIGELLHTLDQDRFNAVIALLVEFKQTGRLEGFNALHANARARLSGEIADR